MDGDKEWDDMNMPRGLTVIPWVIWALVLVILIWTTKALAEEPIPVHVVEREEVKMRLMSGPCTDPVSIGLIMNSPVEYHGRFKAVSSQWKDERGNWKEFAGCWMELKASEVPGTPGDVIVLVFSDGWNGAFLKRDLIRKAGAGA